MRTPITNELLRDEVAPAAPLVCGVTPCETPTVGVGYWGPTRYGEIFLACSNHGPLISDCGRCDENGKPE